LTEKTLNKLIHPNHLLSNALNIQEPNLILIKTSQRRLDFFQPSEIGRRISSM
jgi:hypothetical protein